MGKYLKQVKLKNFMSRGKDLVWNLDKSVNILGGGCGSGKTMLMGAIYSLVQGRASSSTWVAESAEVTVVDGDKETTYISGSQYPSIMVCDYLSDDMSCPDYDIMHYEDVTWTDAHPSSRKKLARILNSLLEYKTVNMKDTVNLSFIIQTTNGEQRLQYEQLSLGEQRLLMAVLRAMVYSKCKEGVLLIMDLPELGMHIDIQRKLILTLKNINPHMQIICATHTPPLIDGWMDKVSEINQLIIDNEEQ